MNLNRQKRRDEPAPSFEAGALGAGEIDRLLVYYYGRLVQWGAVLTKADPGKALDLVHDFCLYLKLSRPDLSRISNLEGYLYRSLRHTYLSNLARSSREALHLVSIADFDSARLALTRFETINSLYRQNDLRKICCFAVRRKAQAKSASYFILRFFHGYDYEEIADLVRVSVTSIYSVCSKFRMEAKAYLQESGRLHIASHDLSPVPALRWTPVSSQDLFGELRKTVLDACTGQCLPERELLRPYISKGTESMSCSLLSHVVSCERCLNVIDRYLRRPTLDGRGPLDSIDDLSEATNRVVSNLSAAETRDRLLGSVQEYEIEAFHHRPSKLSIAADGKIIASRAVATRQNDLSAIIENPDSTKFIEVFSDLGIRLAMVPIDELPPTGPQGISQRVVLSSDRWLELNLSFVGVGLNIEVVYFDPALSIEELNQHDSAEVSPSLRESKELLDSSSISSPQPKIWLKFVRQFLHPLTVFPVLNWSMAITCIGCLAGYIAWHNSKGNQVLSPAEVLNRSIAAEAASLRGETGHQVFRFEETAADGSVFARGTIDVWREGDGKRYIRRLYNSLDQLIAAEGRQRDGSHNEYPKGSDTQLSGTDRELLVGGLWKLDVSSSAFRALSGEKTAVRSTADGYELTVAEPGASHAEIVSATLVLDRSLHPVRETVRCRSQGTVREVHFVQADYERRPSSSVPDTTFVVREQGQHARVQRRTVTDPVITTPAITDVQLTELRLAVLYQLSNLGADSREMIDVRQTAALRIRIAGSVADDGRKQEILAHLNQLENHELLELEIVSPEDSSQSNIDLPQTSVNAITTYSAREAGPPAEAALRQHFQAQGLSRKELDHAVTSFSHEILTHSQFALREAGAIKRLGDDFPVDRLRFVSLTARQQWSEMVARHASALESELRSLREQLTPLALASESSFVLPDKSSIESAEQFACSADELFVQMKGMRKGMIDIFASNELASLPASGVEPAIDAAFGSIPLERAARMSIFAARLNASARMALGNQQESRSEPPSPNRP